MELGLRTDGKDSRVLRKIIEMEERDRKARMDSIPDIPQVDSHNGD